MNVYAEILEWSAARPLWVRDALRRLVVHNHLTEADLEELLAIGLNVRQVAGAPPLKQAAVPLAQGDLPAGGGGGDSVSFVRLHSLAAVNALIPNQELALAPSGLCTIYGDNGAGKSGYAKVFKRACRARGRGDAIRANVFAPSPGPARATFELLVGGAPLTVPWTDGEAASTELAHVNVFDSHTAALYVGQEGPLDLRPAGLDLFERLATVAGSLQQRLASLVEANKAKQFRPPDVENSTAAGRLLRGLTAKTKYEDAERLGRLAPEEATRKKELETLVAQLRAEDPAKRAQELRLRARRLTALADRLARLQTALSAESQDALGQSRRDLATKREAAHLAATTAFAAAPLQGVGQDVWKALWESARRFSTECVYPGHEFPNVSEDAHCVLCQQPLQAEARGRLLSFDAYVRHETAAAWQTAERSLTKTLKDLEQLSISDESVTATVDEIRATDGPLAERAEAFIGACTSLRKQMLQEPHPGAAGPQPFPDAPLPDLRSSATLLVLK